MALRQEPELEYHVHFGSPPMPQLFQRPPSQRAQSYAIALIQDLEHYVDSAFMPATVALCAPAYFDGASWGNRMHVLYLVHVDDRDIDTDWLRGMFSYIAAVTPVDWSSQCSQRMAHPTTYISGTSTSPFLVTCGAGSEAALGFLRS